MWFRERVYKLDESHNKTDKVAAYSKTIEYEKIPLGVLYQVEKPTYEDQLAQLADGPLVQKQLSLDVNGLIEEFV